MSPAEPRRGASVAWATLVVLLYFFRPFSCAWALNLEPLGPDDHYSGVDPHGFGVLGAMAMAMLGAVPVLWLLLQRRPADAPTPARATWRGAAVMAVVGTPMLLQPGYLRLPFPYDVPVIASIALWFAAKASACLNTAAWGPSVHGAFDRFPRTAWSLVGVLAVGKLALLTFALEAA